MKTFKLGFIIGRFQHFHRGHEKMLETALNTCERVLLLVGSSQEAFTERNPFTLKTRMDLIRDLYKEEIENERLLLAHIDDMTNEHYHSKDWGDYVLQRVDMWSQHYGLNNSFDCMIFGNDEGRMEWFRPEKVQHVSQIILGRPDDEISATKMREYIINEDYDSWCDGLPVGKFIYNDDWFERLKDELMLVDYYKKVGAKHG